jgi:membrane protease YdiL (CAAX protease family)
MNLLLLLVWGALASLLSYWACRRRLFSQSGPLPHHPPPSWKWVLSVFVTYLALSILAAKHLPSWIIHTFHIYDSTAIITWTNFIVSMALTGLLYGLTFMKHIRHILIRRHHFRFVDDSKKACWFFLLALPWVFFTSSLSDWLLQPLTQGRALPEQIAVQFLKATFHSPLYFCIASLTVVILAPLLEELLFRGYLQSWLHYRVGHTLSLTITSLLFALFHYAPGQSLTNIPVIASLFVFALFLGRIYAIQGSLFAPIQLHALFNLTSVINLYVFGDILDQL